MSYRVGTYALYEEKGYEQTFKKHTTFQIPT